ncbi:MAG: twin-arginine translocase subunit TatC [Bdellovibrionales bacterium]
MNPKGSELFFTQHLRELRDRLIKILVAFFIGFAVSWLFKDLLMELIRQPIAPYLTSTSGKLIFTSPIEKFLSYIKVAFFASLVLSCPYWLLQIGKFISPGLHKAEKKGLLLFVIFGSLLFLMGSVFIYFIVLPLAFQFLISFGGSSELAYISLKEYISFFLRTSLVFGLVFETPLVLVFLIRLKLVSVQQLKDSRPYVVVLIAVLSAFATPPDILSMLFLMLPLYLFYEISIWIGRKFQS